MPNKSEARNSIAGLGPKSSAWLHDAGIHSREAIEALGPVMVYRIVKHLRPEVTLNFLYAVHALVNHEDWRALSSDVKRQLRESAASPGAFSVTVSSREG